MKTRTNLLLGLGYALALGLLSLMIWVNFAPAQARVSSGGLNPAAPHSPTVRPKNFEDTLGGCNPSNSSICAQIGSYPVTVPTGNFWHTFSDLSLPGRGPALHFVRTYNSMPASLTGTGWPTGPLGGPGWTHNYNMSISWQCDALFCNTTNHWIVTQENASIAGFNDQSGSSYPPQEGEHATLISDTTGVFILTRNQSQDKFIFHHCDRGSNGGCQNTGDPLAGKLEQIVDRNNYTTTLSYTSTGALAGFLDTVTDLAGGTLQMSYSQYGGVWVLTRVQDSTGRHVDFGYDANHDLRTATDVAGNTSSYTYDTNRQMLTLTDPLLGVVTNTYNGGDGAVIQQTDPLSRTLLFSYLDSPCGGLSSQLVATMTDALSYTTVYTSGCFTQGLDRRIIQVTHNRNRPDEANWHYYYDDSQHPWDRTRVQDPAGHIYTTTYDTNGNLASITDPLSRKMTYRYDAMSNLLVVTNTRGVTTTFGYDTNGNLTSIMQPLTATSQLLTTTISYDSGHPGDAISIQDPLNHQWSFTHDPTYGYVITATDSLTDVTGYRYDTLGRATTVYTPRGYTATAAYNDYGDPTAITDTLGYTTTLHYDSNRNLLRVNNSKDITTTYTYNADSELTRVTNADDTHSDYGYDGNGNLISQSNGLGQSTTYGYDSFNRVMTVTTPLTVTAVYSYDLVGNLKVLTNAQGLTTTFGYNNADELTGITYHDGGVTPNVSFSYAAPGLRSGMTDGTGTSAYTYDSLDRLISAQDGLGATVGYAYDLAGRLTSLTYPGSPTHAVTRSYDEAHRQITLKDWLNHTYTFKYDPDGNLSELDYPNAVVEALGYDAGDQLTSLSYSHGLSNILSLTYTRDPLGLLGTAVESGTGTHTYEYDKLSRLAGDGLSALPTITRTWGYDGAYEITDTRYQAGSSTPITTTRGYNAGNQLLSLQERPQGGALTRDLSFLYSTTGNRTRQHDAVSNQTINYTYDQANRLTDYNGVKQYRYNGDGLRMQKSTNIGWQNFTWDVGAGLPLLLQDAGGSYIYGPDGGLVAQITSGGDAYYYHADQLGSVRALTDKNGTVVDSYQYDAYGNLTASSVTVGNPFGYAGEYTDSESGLIYLRARYYDPATQQFLTVDPLLAATEQAYNYAGGNPVNGLDPSGLTQYYSNSEVIGLIGELINRKSGYQSSILPTDQAGFIGFAAGVVITEAISSIVGAVALGVLFGPEAAPFGAVGLAIAEIPTALTVGSVTSVCAILYQSGQNQFPSSMVSTLNDINTSVTAVTGSGGIGIELEGQTLTILNVVTSARLSITINDPGVAAELLKLYPGWAANTTVGSPWLAAPCARWGLYHGLPYLLGAGCPLPP